MRKEQTGECIFFSTWCTGIQSPRFCKWVWMYATNYNSPIIFIYSNSTFKVTCKIADFDSGTYVTFQQTPVISGKHGCSRDGCRGSWLTITTYLTV